MAPSRPELEELVSVFLFCGDGVALVTLEAVDRVVPAEGNPLRSALTQMLLGVTPSEAVDGWRSAFSSYTAGTLREATVEAGVATLGLTSGFELTNNFSTSNLSSVVLSQIDATVFQFPEITGIELEIDGERWCGWENTCDGQPVPFRARS